LGKLLGDFTLAWGLNSSGQLGDGTITDRSSPVTVIGGITDWASVSGGGYHSLGITNTGIAYAWGYNGQGQLGDGTTTQRSSPVTVIGGITDWASVSAGNRHSLGVTDAGIAYAWGYNSFGRLGDDTTTNRSSPVTVIGAITDWASVSAGNSHSLGVTDSGIAYAWGRNSQGQLGDGTDAERSSPVMVIGGITNWVGVSGGGTHSLGVTATGIAYAWGNNGNGRLGDDTTTARSSPVTVIGGITDWASVSGGGDHSLGVTDAGIAYAWGSNGNGRLGDGTTTSRSSPVTVIGGITDWAQVAAGSAHSLGVTATGIAYAWGSNSNGRLGDGTTTNRSSPVTVIGAITDWASVSAGDRHSLAIAADTIKTFTK
jgi:alpha-tubulin suppressor-like RCC1 family protein